MRQVTALIIASLMLSGCGAIKLKTTTFTAFGIVLPALTLEFTPSNGPCKAVDKNKPGTASQTKATGK